MANATLDFLFAPTGDVNYPSTFVSPTDYDVSGLIKPNDSIQQPTLYYTATDEVAYHDPNTIVGNPKAKIEHMPKKENTKKPMNSEISDGTDGSATKPSYTEDQVKLYGRAASYLVSSVSDFTNGYLAYDSYKMKASSYEFSAQQQERAADLLEKNIRDINRAAQMDANVYKMQQKDVKSAQKVAMASSGFAVGKGSYRVVLNTTDARTNYNVAMRMLRADLQTAEVTRKAGTYRAQAAIERGNAKISRIQAKTEKNLGIISGVGNLVNSGICFYMGKWGLQGASNKTSDTTKTTSGGKK